MKKNEHGLTFWLYGLSGAGKTTLADLVNEDLNLARLDGDILRKGLSNDLGYDQKDRSENLRRAAHTAAILNNNHLNTVATFMTPTQEHQVIVQDIIKDKLRLIYIKATVADCTDRDPKGLYEKQRQGEIKNLSGVDSPFNVNLHNDCVIDTTKHSIQECVETLKNYILKEIKNV